MIGPVRFKSVSDAQQLLASGAGEHEIGAARERAPPVSCSARLKLALRTHQD
jgi:hypothetical protein